MKVIAPGDPDHSAVMHRITATDPKGRMPFAGEPLSDREAKLIRCREGEA
jgi:cytochrome c